MDEPTVGIDPQSRRAILDMTRQLNAEGMAVLYTTHYMEEAQELSHRIGVIDHGKLIAMGTLAELTRLVGEADTVTLQISGEASELEHMLSQLPAVRNVKRHEQEFTILVDDANAQLADMIAVCSRLDVHVTNLAVAEPNLEAVFLHLTGRALRD
jgi:ABC-2 type transport system ATP-binding protein